MVRRAGFRDLRSDPRHQSAVAGERISDTGSETPLANFIIY